MFGNFLKEYILSWRSKNQIARSTILIRKNLAVLVCIIDIYVRNNLAMGTTTYALNEYKT